ncbi:hypothetical protein FS749_015249 [Ceratobasidium sp. UAMH 11750]|nr:hypothetical protein FS749_015249 [Ceratobasidium sp. UAMH 11750]
MPANVLSSRPFASPTPVPILPHLPLELIWLIIEQTLLQSSYDARKDDNIVTIPAHLITLNRVIHNLVIKLVYRTVIISSSRVLAKFLSLLASSPTIASLVQNIWVGTPRLEAFAHQVGWVPCAVKRILEMTKNMKRLALPAGFFPPGPNRITIRHLTVNGSGFTKLPNGTHTLHTYGLAQPAAVRNLQNRELRQVVCELRRPCAPGAVGRFVRDLLEGSEGYLVLELVVSGELRAWLDEELLGVRESCLRGTLKLRIKGAKGMNESPLDEWTRKCTSS